MTDTQWTLTAPDGQTWQGKSKTEVYEMARQSREAIEKAAKAKEAAREKLKALIDAMKIPAAVAQGGVVAAVSFKEALIEAHKVLARSNATTQSLQEAVAQMERYAS